MIDILQPATDRGAITQWIALAVALPLVVVFLYRAGRRDAARAVLGLGTLTAAWFVLRAVH